MLRHILMAVMCMQLLHILHMHSLKLTPQYQAFMHLVKYHCYKNECDSHAGGFDHIQPK